MIMIKEQPQKLSPTREKILDAFCSILVNQGLAHATVTSIAEKAGVSKVLIYKYFGGLEGLVKCYIQRGGLFPKLTNFEQILLNETSLENLQYIWYLKFKQISINYKESNEYKALIEEGLLSNSKVASNITTLIDDEINTFFKQLSPIEGIDMEAISALLISGLSYLCTFEKKNRLFLGDTFPSDQSWNRIDSAIKTIFSSLGKTK